MGNSKTASQMSPEELFEAMILKVEKLEAELNKVNGELNQERLIREGSILSIMNGNVCINWELAPPEAVKLTIFDGLYQANRRPYYWINDKNEMLVNGRWIYQDHVKTSGYVSFGKD